MDILVVPDDDVEPGVLVVLVVFDVVESIYGVYVGDDCIEMVGVVAVVDLPDVLKNVGAVGVLVGVLNVSDVDVNVVYGVDVPTVVALVGVVFDSVMVGGAVEPVYVGD